MACNRNNYSVSLKLLSFNLNLLKDHVQNKLLDDFLLLLPPVTAGIIAGIQFMHKQLLLPDHEITPTPKKKKPVIMKLQKSVFTLSQSSKHFGYSQ
jgi:hypothetical protein